MARIGRHQLTLLLEARRGPVRIRANDPALHGVRKNAAAALIRRELVERVKVAGIGARGQSWNFASVRLTKAGELALLQRNFWPWPPTIRHADHGAVLRA